MKVMLREQFVAQSWDVFVYREIAGYGRYFQQPDGSEVMVAVNHVQYPDELRPTFKLDYHTAQQLMAAMQHIGVRPVEVSKVEGILEAQTKHLDDLRNILKTKKVMS